MRSAIKSLLLICFLVGGLGLFSWVFLRHDDSLHAHKAPLSHPFLAAAPAHDSVAYHWVPTAAPNHPYSPEHLKALSALPEQVVLWIEVRQRLDGTMVACDSENEAADAPLLNHVLVGLPKHRLILNFRGNREGSVERFAKIVDETKIAERLLIQSPEDGFLKDLREARPLWLYGTSLAQVTRLIMLSSIGLGTLAPLKGDVLVVEAQNPKEHLLDRLSDSIIAEAHRRQMRIYAGPATTEEALQLWSRGVDGIMSAQPDALIKASSH